MPDNARPLGKARHAHRWPSGRLRCVARLHLAPAAGPRTLRGLSEEHRRWQRQRSARCDEAGRDQYRDVQIDVHLVDPAGRSRHHRRDLGAGLAWGDGVGAGHLVRGLRVRRRRAAGRAGVQRRFRGTGLRAPAARARGRGGRGGGPGVARAHGAGAGGDRGDLGVHRRLCRDLRWFPQRQDPGDPRAVHPGRAGVRGCRLAGMEATAFAAVRRFCCWPGRRGAGCGS